MAALRDRPRLYYDAGCGPCSFFARVGVWAGRSRLRALPYDGPEAARELATVDPGARFTSAHLVEGRVRHSGADIMLPLVRLTMGPAGARIVARVPLLDLALRWMYRRFWNYRRTHGCDVRVTSAAS